MEGCWGKVVAVRVESAAGGVRLLKVGLWVRRLTGVGGVVVAGNAEGDWVICGWLCIIG